MKYDKFIGRIVHIEISNKRQDVFLGYLLEQSEDFVLLQMLDSFHWDGYIAIKKIHIKSCYAGASARFIEKVMQKEELWAASIFHTSLDISSEEAFLLDCLRKRLAVSTRCENFGRGLYLVLGYVTNVGSRRLTMRSISTKGILTESLRYLPRNLIQSYSFGDRYAEYFAKYAIEELEKIPFSHIINTEKYLQRPRMVEVQWHDDYGGGYVSGFIINESDDFLHMLPFRDFIIDGHILIKKKCVAKCIHKRSVFYEDIVYLEKLIDSDPAYNLINISSEYSFLKECMQSNRAISIDTFLQKRGDELELGFISNIGINAFFIQAIGSSGVISRRNRRIAFGCVRSYLFGDRYTELYAKYCSECSK